MVDNLMGIYRMPVPKTRILISFAGPTQGREWHEYRYCLHGPARPAAVWARTPCFVASATHSPQHRLRSEPHRSLVSRGASARQHRRIWSVLCDIVSLVRRTPRTDLGHRGHRGRDHRAFPAGRWPVVGAIARQAEPGEISWCAFDLSDRFCAGDTVAGGLTLLSFGMAHRERSERWAG